MRVSDKQRQELLTDVMISVACGNWDGVVGDTVPARYRGEQLVVNEHGNVSLYWCFANGNRRLIADRV